MVAKKVTQNWTWVEPGDEVVIIDANGNETAAIVDEKTLGSDVVWVTSPQGGNRRAYDHRQGMKILPS